MYLPGNKNGDLAPITKFEPIGALPEIVQDTIIWLPDPLNQIVRPDPAILNAGCGSLTPLKVLSISSL